MAPSNGHMMKDVMGGAQVLPINLPSGECRHANAIITRQCMQWTARCTILARSQRCKTALKALGP